MVLLYKTPYRAGGSNQSPAPIVDQQKTEEVLLAESLMAQIAVRDKQIAQAMEKSLASKERQLAHNARELAHLERALRAATRLGQLLPVNIRLIRKIEQLRHHLQTQYEEADLIRGKIEALAREAGAPGPCN